MISLLNELVQHKKYGIGKVIGEEEGKVEIEFNDAVGNKRFVFPDAFSGFLVLNNQTLQSECEDLVNEKKRQIQEEAERVRLEQIMLEEEEKKREKEEKKKKTVIRRKKKTE